MQALGKHHKRERERLRQTQKRERRFQSRRRWQSRAQIKPRDPSVEVRASWRVMEEIEFLRLGKVVSDPGEPSDLLTCGLVLQGKE